MLQSSFSSALFRFLTPKKVVCVILGGMAVSVITMAGTSYLTLRTETVTVTQKERVAGNDQVSSQYQIWTDKGVFTVKDDLFQLHFSAADTYGALEVGRAYRVRLNGFRIPIASMFPNVVQVEEVTQ